MFSCARQLNQESRHGVDLLGLFAFGSVPMLHHLLLVCLKKVDFVLDAFLCCDEDLLLLIDEDFDYTTGPLCGPWPLLNWLCEVLLARFKRSARGLNKS